MNEPSFLIAEIPLATVKCQVYIEMELPHSEVSIFQRLHLYRRRLEKSCFDIESWRSFSKAVRVIAWILRFAYNACHDRGRVTVDLILEELTKAKSKLLIYIQEKKYSSELESLKMEFEYQKLLIFINSALF